MPRPKNDPTAEGYREHSGFWKPVQVRIGKKMVAAGFMTDQEWRDFIEGGSWLRLRATAENPALLSQADHREAFANEYMRHPLAVAHFLAWFYDELQKVSPVEEWLFKCQVIQRLKSWRPRIADEERKLGRPLKKEELMKLPIPIPTYKELAAAFTEETRQRCTAEQIQRSVENLRRRMDG